jgi:hypothetical protein
LKSELQETQTIGTHQHEETYNLSSILDPRNQTSSEIRGFDTIFRVVDGPGSTANEMHIIEEWGDLQLHKIEMFVSNLADPYDLENL